MRREGTVPRARETGGAPRPGVTARVVLCAAMLATFSPPAAAQWDSRAAGGRVEAGSTVQGAFAGLLLRCSAPGRVELALTHNGAAFDRSREHTLSVSVDGVATLLPARAVAVAGGSGDEFVHDTTAASLDGLLDALSRGGAVEISAPSGRYTLPLAGSARAIAAFRAACPPA